MPAPPLHSVQDAVSRAETALGSGEKYLAFTGRFGAGKTSALDELQSRLETSGRKTVRVSLPFGDDAAFAALSAMSDRLDALGQNAGELARDHGRSFSDRLDQLASKIPADAVLLFDEPRIDGTHAIDDTIFDWRAAELTQRLLEARRDQPVVITSRARERSGPRPFRIHVERASSPRDVLSAAGMLGDVNVAQLVSLQEDVLARCSPIEIRLAAAAASAGQLQRVVRSSFDLSDLLEIAAAQVTPAIRRALGRLSLIRGVVFPPWFEWGTRGLTAAEKTTIRTVFLFGSEDKLRLHESIAILATRNAWLSDLERQAAHRELAERYKQRFNPTGEASPAFRFDIECIHHKTLAADASLLDDTLYFAEQYDMLGRVFGVRAQELHATNRQAARENMRLAVRAYERALEHEPDDWYAEHYRAFNLDALGGDVTVIGPAYERVIETLNPGFVWGHSRYIRWLITCGRLKEARVAFSVAEREFLGQPDDARLYEELHVDVARQALENGHHAFASQILEKVPEQLRGELVRYEPLRLWARHQAEIEEGEIVFPPTVEPEERWVRPALAQADEHIEQYWPAVVTAQEGLTWKFRVAFAPDALGWRSLDAAELTALGFDAGLKPLPVGTYGEFIKVAGRERLETHRPQGVAFEKQRVQFPDPRRYVRDEQG